MRTGVLVVALIFMLNDWGGQRHPVQSAAIANARSSGGQLEWSVSSNSRIDFDTQIKPILQSKCMPCHFSGGAQYVKLPFDRPETIRKLGTKLFNRIQDENHRRLIRDFLAQ
jgi:hypothetical protein